MNLFKKYKVADYAARWWRGVGGGEKVLPPNLLGVNRVFKTKAIIVSEQLTDVIETMYLSGGNLKRSYFTDSSIKSVDFSGLDSVLLSADISTRIEDNTEYYKGFHVGVLWRGVKVVVCFRGGIHLYLRGATADICILDSLYDELLKRFVYEVDKEDIPIINLVVQSSGSLTTRSYDIAPIEINKDYYNASTLDFYDKTLSTINTSDRSLHLMHGDAGTGKTYLIRSLIKAIDKPVFFIPPFMVEALSSPEFIEFAIRNLKGGVLVIEDCEGALKESAERRPSVANLLNISDGILGDILKCHIICTFNAHISTIDPALTRKGRLTMKHEFTKLTPDKVNNLIGVNDSMTLAEVLNSESNGAEIKRKVMGFK